MLVLPWGMSRRIDNIGGDSRGQVALFMWVSLALIVVAVTMQAGFIPFTGPCGNDGAQQVSSTAFDIDEDAEAGVTTVTHNGNDWLGGDRARAVYLQFHDNETERTARASWAENGTGTFPITPGDSMTVRWNETADWVDAGDRVRVVYRGYDKQMPLTCPNNRLTNRTIGADRL